MNDALSSVFDALPHAAIAVSAQGVVTAVNARAIALLEASEEGLVGASWAGLLEQVGLPRRLSAGDPLDGSRVQLRGRIDLDVDANQGEDGAWVYLLRQPSARTVEDARLRTLLLASAEASLDAIEITNREQHFVYVNPAWQRLTGYSRDEVLGRCPREFLRSGAHSVAFYREIEDTVGRGERWSGRMVSRRKDGSRIEMEIDLEPQRTAAGVHVGTVGIRRDLSVRRETEMLARQLQHAERMAGLGQLASGVAHEINNPLTYVMANLSWLDRELEARYSGDMAEILEVLRESQSGAGRIASIVGDLKIFARSRDDETLAAVDLEAACEAAINLARNQIEHRARLVKEYVPTVALANEVRLVQVLVNLLVNASHAIQVGDAGHNVITVSTQQTENLVYVEVRDTGSGIRDEDLPHIFEPFFTTKGQGEGTGLGLSVCLGLIEKMGGRIDVDSRPGEGSTFRITLHGAAPDEGPTTRDLKRSQRAPGIRLLVVDDEPLIGQSLRRLLRDDDVSVAHDGPSALALLGRDAEFDFVLCDVMMPGMTGLELAEAIAEAYPWLAQRIALITGGVFIPEIRRKLAAIDTPCFDKPLDLDELRGWFSSSQSSRNR